MEDLEARPSLANLQNVSFDDEDLFSDISDLNDPPYVPDSNDDNDDEESSNHYHPLHQYINSSCIEKSQVSQSLTFTPEGNQPPTVSVAAEHVSHPQLHSVSEEGSQQCDTVPLEVVSEETGGNIPDRCVGRQQISGIHVTRAPTKLDKQHYCLFCGKPQTKLKRHLLHKHSDEADMISFHNASSSQKKVELAKLRNLGNYQHNQKILKEGKGEIVVKRKGKEETQTSEGDFVSCENCLAFFLKHNIWRHRCPVKEGSKKGLAKKGRLLLGECSDDSIFRQVLESLRHDSIAIVAKNDELIKLLAFRETCKNGYDKDRHNYIRNKLREMARFLLILRKRTKKESATLSEFIKPEFFSEIVQSTKELAGYSECTSEYEKPSLATKIGHSLVRCSLLLKAKAIETGDSVLKSQCEEYQQVHEIRWDEEVSCQAQRTLYQKKKNQPNDMPILDDVKRLTDYLNKEATKARGNLEDESFQDKKAAWIRLAEVTLCHIILFNRRRQGEASKIKLQDYVNGIENSQKHNADVLKGLSKFEESLCKILTRIEITGKRGRTVPVILTADMKLSVDLLVRYREVVGVNPQNVFLFARAAADSQDHIRGSDCFRKLVQTPDIGLLKPDVLRSTLLRKHLATMTQLVNLKDNELDILAQYLGHDVRVHRDYYRLPTATVQVAKVSQILLAMSNGGMMDAGDGADDNSGSDLDEPGGLLETKRVMITRTKQKTISETTAATQIHSSKSVYEKEVSKAEAAKKDVKRDMTGRRKWSADEEAACMKYFYRHITMKRLPGKGEIEKVIEQEPQLQRRTWIQVKNFIRNIIKKA